MLASQPVVAFETPPPPTISPTFSTVVVSGSPAPADGFTDAVVTVTVVNTAEPPCPVWPVRRLTASPQNGANVQAVGGVRHVQLGTASSSSVPGTPRRKP